jgi:outer membrane protein OmpA-like peptidoglycan-associated protein
MIKLATNLPAGRIFLFGQVPSEKKNKMKNSKSLKIVFILSILLALTVSVFAQVDVPRQTTAITYPLDEIVSVQFRGTTRFPRMKGEARMKRTSKNGTEIELSVSKMPRPFELGAGYATYVLWAISPDGQADNLGEIKRRGFFEFDSNISVTTPLQTFSLIITAEPHFLVRRPSRAVMLENLNPVSKSGRVIPVAKSIQFFGNSSDYFRDARTPEIAETDYSKTPSAVLQAKQAVALARYAGATQDAAQELKQAETFLQNADSSWKAGRDEETVDIAARQAISLAVKAEDTALIRKEAREKRNERSRQDAELQQSEDRIAEAQRQIENLKSELASEQRARELSERDVSNYTEQIKQLRSENSQLRDELSKIRSESEDAKIKLARYEGEKQVMDQQRDRENQQRENEARVNRVRASVPILMQSLSSFGAVRQTERGIVLTLNDSYWASVRGAEFAPAAETRLNDLASILANNPEYKIAVESHIDSKGTPGELMSLTESRAQTFMSRLASSGVDQSRIEAKGFGATLPIAPNTTLASRGKNRRIELVIVPNIEQQKQE